MSGTLMVAVAAGEGLLSAGVATAAPPAGTQGSLTITPAVGTDNSIVNARTSSGCPTTAAGAATFVEGPIGAPNPTFPHENPFTIVTPGGPDFSTTGPFDQPFRLTLKSAAEDRGKVLQVGEYDITTRCVDAF
ncbi:MAG: hypothetical protein ACRDQ9_02390, partial [Pseudonocardiaceae bacterium]